MGRPPIGKSAMSDAERQRRHRAKFRDRPVTESVDATGPLKARIAALETRQRELEAELRSERARAVVLPHEPAKPPLPPDEQRDKTIRTLKTQNANLRAKIRDLDHHFHNALAKAS